MIGTPHAQRHIEILEQVHLLKRDAEDVLRDAKRADNVSSEMLDSGEFWTLLDKALAKLPTEQREVFIAHEIEDLSFKEISEKTGVSVNTLLARKRYAVLRLREMFDREQGAGSGE